MSLVLKSWQAWPENSQLTLKELSIKLVVLLLLVTSQRGATILALSADRLEFEEDNAIFRLDKLLKHNQVWDPLDLIVLRSYHRDKKLCIVLLLKSYLRRTRDLRGSYRQLILSYSKPHKPISRDTLSRWTLLMLRLSGIDISKYKSHSTRGASTSRARALGIPLNAIMKHAGWKAATSFANYYNKKIEVDTTKVAQALLDSVYSD